MSLKQEVSKILNDLENPDGSHVPVQFYERARYNPDESEKLGRPVYKNAIFVRKHKDSLSVVDAPARDEDIKMFPAQYRKFIENKQQKEDGIPVGMLPGITPDAVSFLEKTNIYTVEKLAEIDETLLIQMGNKSLKTKALAYLNGKSEQEVEIENLKKQLEQERCKNVSPNNGAKRRGRKPAVRKTH